MIRDALGLIIEKNLSKNSTTLEKGIIKYVDRNSDILLSFDLSVRFSFSDADRKVVYDTIGVEEEQFIAEIKKSKDINKSNKIHTNPFYNACVLTMRQCILSKKEKLAKEIMAYMSLNMYVSVHKGSFKYGANKQIMDYTIANLDNSYRIRHVPSLYAFLVDNAEVAYDTYKSRITKADDKDITWVVDALWVRIKGKIKKIANAYYENHKNGNYLNMDTNSYEQDDYHEMDSESYMIDRLANKVYIKLLNHQFDARFIKYSITQSDTSYTKLKNIIDDVISDDTDNTVKKFISSAIEYFVTYSGKPFAYIARGEFISFMKSAYSSSAENPQLLFMKSTVDRWMKENMYKYGKANYGKTAMQQYKKSIYMFFIFVINHEAKTV